MVINYNYNGQWVFKATDTSGTLYRYEKKYFRPIASP